VESACEASDTGPTWRPEKLCASVCLSLVVVFQSLDLVVGVVAHLWSVAQKRSTLVAVCSMEFGWCGSALFIELLDGQNPVFGTPAGRRSA